MEDKQSVEPEFYRFIGAVQASEIKKREKLNRRTSKNLKNASKFDTWLAIMTDD